VFASSVVLHVLGFALAGWATHGNFRALIAAPGGLVTRAYAVYHLVPTHPPTRAEIRPEARPEPRPQARPERRRPIPPAPVAPASLKAPAATSPAGVKVIDSSRENVPRRSPVRTEELAPGAVAGVGHIMATRHSDSAGSREPAGMLGYRVPTPRVRPARLGQNRVAELVGGASSACPELRTPATWSKRQFAVAVAFVVDTNGAVDQATLRVIESPDRPQTEHRFHSHIYVVGASVRVDPDRINPAAYDSLLTEEVASHVAGLVFRPALREGRAIRSTVLVSCQTS
jgi:hypothetical protein